MTVSVAVMAVKERAHFVGQLLERLGIGPETVVWDQKRDRCDTGLRAMQAHDPDATHHLVIQDDALVCDDLLPSIDRLVQHTEDHPVSLYVGRVRPHPQQVQKHFNDARQAGSALLKMRGPLWGVGIVYPVHHIAELSDWYVTHEHPNYDMRVSRWYMRVKALDCLYTIPSLVDHRPVFENPSTIPDRTGNRTAHWFLGQDASALDIQWETKLAGSESTVPSPSDLSGFGPQDRVSFRRTNGRVRTVRVGHGVAAHMAADPAWTLVTEADDGVC